MTLRDLIDVEAQLARDREVEPEALRVRDRAVLAGEPLPRTRAALLARWIARLRETEPGLLFPGRAVAAALRATRLALVVVGAALGWAAAAGVLQFTGGRPVDVWDFLLVFVLLQLALLALLLGSFVAPVGQVGVPFVGVLRSLAAWAYPRLSARLAPEGARRQEWRALWNRLRSRRSLYRGVEPWLLLGTTQRFGVAFNVAALAAALRLVAFSDLAFSWGTTLVALDAARFHALVRALATPFGWAFPGAVPSLALVEATRYSRLESAYAGAGVHRASDPALVGGWWPFLVIALVTYGLLPRLLALAAADVGARRALRRLPLDDVEVSRAVARLTAPRVETRGAGAEPPPPDWPARPTARPSAATRHPLAVVRWRDAPLGEPARAAIERAHGPIAAVHAAGGRDHEEAALDWASIATAGEPALLAEAWEAPDRGVLRLLAQARRALGPTRTLRVLLAGVDGRPPGAEDVTLWDDGLARLEDPYLAVEPLAPAPRPALEPERAP